MRLPLALALALVAACDRPAPPLAHTADSLRAQLRLAPQPPARDSAAGPNVSPDSLRQRQFERCAYVYRDVDGVRECLVFKSGWQPQDAERAIAIYRGWLAAQLDSLRREVAAEERALAARRSAARIAELSRPMRFIGSKSERMYFRDVPGCPEARTIPANDRVVFPHRWAVMQSGFRPSDDAVCQ